MKRASLLLWVLLVWAIPAKAEYRAYLLEVYDHILGKQWEAATGFQPDHYIVTHGGGNRLSAIIKATWMCWGDLSRYAPVCKMPPTKDPKFEVGDLLEVTLKKHMTESWQGRVELSLWREDLKSNVYGLRFGKEKNLYGRYFEFDLKLIEKGLTKIEVQTDQPNAPPPQAVDQAGNPQAGAAPVPTTPVTPGVNINNQIP
ncbi:MAG: hypothetical protein A2527_04185 [Candidatus Lambdaproteobacteria bacterium RIFOXYD2_FULL_50_16]|uniref:Uncharacterized protein n=1 Tax=Candidatus Lambdaproteobacteria bacterium RIFOXYD2_FULL_50_16 TaxID=1817772 RepID=A0A1F6GF58_9PROT|nr:MAG: hypothetical protein A2527_04185 [Candidatus Lambdaproteobacteria bacterium RIFOXYD2_FULL_50_16]